MTNGSPCTDIALIENTALKGAQIAVAYAELMKEHQEEHEPKHVTTVRHVIVL
jgi:hypothetical protein